MKLSGSEHRMFRVFRNGACLTRFGFCSDNMGMNNEINENKNESAEVIFTGTISVKAVLEARAKDCRILFVNKDKRTRDIAYIISLAKRSQIPVELLSKTEMNLRFEKAGVVALEALPRSFESLSACRELSGMAVYLSGVEDPHNLGSCIRSLYAAGTRMVILPRRRWDFASSVLLRASAGAWEKMPVFMIENENELIEFRNRMQISMFCASRRDPLSLFEYEMPETCIGVIGGALRGISAALENACDARVCIPYGRDFRNALDTPSAAAVFAFAWLKEHPANIEK